MYDIACLHPSFSIRSVNNDTRLRWNPPPKNILIILKKDLMVNGSILIPGLKSLIVFLLKYVEANVMLEEESLSILKMEADFEAIVSKHLRINGLNDTNRSEESKVRQVSEDWESFPTVWSGDIELEHFSNGSIVPFNCASESQTQMIDMIICIGGDGTLLHVNSIFQNTVPPVLSFYMGSLGFLTPFNFADFPGTLMHFCKEGGQCLLRSRLCCRLIRRGHSEDWLEEKNDNIFHVLNETTFHRGNCPYLTNLILSVDGKEVTSIQGDGLIVSTPTGSTAYSLSAGASILNAAVPALLVTPINPHTLSCRPLVLPMGTRLEVSIDPKARANTIHLSHDGRLCHRHLLEKGDRVVITASPYPFPCFCPETQVADWFCDLAHCLNWNVRHRQNEFNEARFFPDKFKSFRAVDSASSFRNQ